MLAGITVTFLLPDKRSSDLLESKYSAISMPEVPEWFISRGQAGGMLEYLEAKI
jgi:hypothetical protein